jgi:hypothetical protein
MLSHPASSSRLLASSALQNISTFQVRHVHGKPRYPKRTRMVPWTSLTRDPHKPRLPLPSSGPSQPRPRDLVPESEYVSTTSSVPLGDTQFTLHHTPPASAPSYTTGAKPDMLRWLGGESVRLTGEENAPLLREAKEPVAHLAKTWDQGVLDQIRHLRSDGLSRTKIAGR